MGVARVVEAVEADLPQSELAHISRKKPILPLSPRLRLYLSNYERKTKFSLHYSDLKQWQDSVPLEDSQGRPSYWDTIIYQQAFRQEIDEELVAMYCLLKLDGDMTFKEGLLIDRIDFCNFANSYPFRIKVVNQYNDNHDYFYVKNADASRIYGLELEHLLSPNNINFLVHENTLIEEHIAGIPGDTYMNDYVAHFKVNPVRLAKEFVKFNERCFVRLLGDMRAYNYVVDVTMDFDQDQYRVRAIDFDQQSYEGDIKIYLPHFHKENQLVVKLVTQHLTLENIRQYQKEERVLMAKRAKSVWGRLLELIDTMEQDPISSPEKIVQLGEGLANYHNNGDFKSCRSMAELLRKNLEVCLDLSFLTRLEY